MITKTVEKSIPAYTYTETIYIAEDGKEFRSETACKVYEDKLRMQKHRVSRSYFSVMDMDDLPVYFYLIQDKSDLKFFAFYCFRGYYKDAEDIFKQHGPGWYAVTVIDGGDYSDTVNIYWMQDYINNLKEELNRYLTEISNNRIVKETDLGYGEG